ncbi:MAG: multidrug efflux system [Candidatus Tokpelaia sp. JSC189]|nr:MAG: multidrug efflux system [Candidatus Tokpelaia sp. JSC189]
MKFSNGFSASLVFGVMGLILIACSDGKKSEMRPPVLVSAVTIHRHEVPVTYEYAGRVAAFKETQVRAQVGGILLQRNFIEGAHVKQGDLLFEVDPASYQAEVERQTALVAQAQAAYQQSVRDANRAQTLLQQRVQSAAMYDQMVAKRDTNAATLQQMLATLRTAQLDLSYTRVTAPISGITSREVVPEGSLIGTDPSSSLLTTITQSDPVYINFSYTDVEAREIRKLMSDMNARGEKLNELKIKIRFGDGREYEQLGVIDFTSPALDITTGTLGVRAVVSNPDDFLLPGQFVRVTVVGLKLDNAVVISEAALLQDSIGTFVYVVDDQQGIERRSVIVVRQLEDRSWLLAPSKKINNTASVDAGSATAPATVGLSGNGNQETAPSLLVNKYIGLNDGDVLVTEGHYRIGVAMAQLPFGMKPKVVVTMLDGQNIDPSQTAAAASSAGSKK